MSEPSIDQILSGHVRVTWTHTPPEKLRSLYSGVDLTTQHNHGYACPCGFVVTSGDGLTATKWMTAHIRTACHVPHPLREDTP